MDEYSILARLYDPLLHLVLNRIRKQVTNTVRYYQPSSIIDICCGTGKQLKHLKKCGFHNITGVDLSKSMLQQANKGNEKVPCDEQDATAMKFDDNSFDLGIISYALHEKPQQSAIDIINEAARVIQPNGHLIVVDYLFDKKVKPHLKASIQLVERIAGKDHYRHFKRYIHYGGMDQLLKNFNLQKEIKFHGGATSIRVYNMDQYGHYA